MANYYYVKHDGTATGDNGRVATTRSTGSFATKGVANYYSDIYDAINTPSTAPTSGDYILCSDLHDRSATFAGVIVIPNGVSVISVDDLNCDQYKPGATENDTGDINDYYFSRNVYIAGMNLETGDDVLRNNGGEPWVHIQDCTLTADTTFDVGLHLTTTGGFARLINVDFSSNLSTAYPINLGEGCMLVWDGGSVTSMTTLFANYFSCQAFITGVDLSSITTFHAALAVAGDNPILRLQNCKLNTSVTLPTSYAKPGQRFEMYNCDDTTGNALYRFFIAGYSGTAKNNDTTYVTATESWYEGTDKSSIEVTTTANCSHAQPFVFELPAQYVNLADSSTITIHLVSEDQLTDTDIAAFLCYPDSTTAVTAKWETSGRTYLTNYGIDPLHAGTNLTDSTESWSGTTGITTPVYSKLELSATGGQATVCSIRIEVYKDSILSGDLFIHPIMTVS